MVDRFCYQEILLSGQRLETFLVVTTWGIGTAGIEGMEVRVAAQSPVVHKAAPSTEIDLGPQC